ncbi:MAG: cytochrome P450 [Pseudomonadota bacterium]
MTLAPIDDAITIDALAADPYPIYRRLRAEAPVCRVSAVGRTMLTRAADTRMVKDDPALFSSDDPNTPMKRAFLAHTLMRKDGEAHLRERMAMAPAFSPRVIRDHWIPIYETIADAYVARLPRGEVVDLFPALAAPFAARCLTHLLGLTDATDDEMIFWSQALIDGAGNFGWADEPFARSDSANVEMEAAMDAATRHHLIDKGPSALSVMVNADEPIETSQIRSNIKIAIGGGLNEPRDALLTVVYGLLTNPDQFEAAKRDALWAEAFEEAIRWVAPIQVSSRLVTADTQIGGCAIPKGDTVMTVQASACRDEALYEDGEVFNLHRPKGQHQAFGNGAHFCQGTHVARRMIADMMLPRLFDRFPRMELINTDPACFHGFAFRGPVRLEVRLT